MYRISFRIRLCTKQVFTMHCSARYEIRTFLTVVVCAQFSNAAYLAMYEYVRKKLINGKCLIPLCFSANIPTHRQQTPLSLLTTRTQLHFFGSRIIVYGLKMARCETKHVTVFWFAIINSYV